MKNFLESVFIVINFFVFLPTVLCAIFFAEVSKLKAKGEDTDTAMVASVYALALLNCAGLWWLIYEFIK